MGATRTAARIAVLAGLVAAGAWLASGRDALAATSCPAGSYAPNTGAAVCAPWAPGHYSAGSGQTACQACPAGTYASSAGLAVCRACPAGTYTAGSGQAKCEPCPAGRFAARPGMEACQACPRGTTSPAGAAVCTAAPS